MQEPLVSTVQPVRRVKAEKVRVNKASIADALNECIVADNFNIVLELELLFVLRLSWRSLKHDIVQVSFGFVVSIRQLEHVVVQMRLFNRVPENISAQLMLVFVQQDELFQDIQVVVVVVVRLGVGANAVDFAQQVNGQNSPLSVEQNEQNFFARFLNVVRVDRTGFDFIVAEIAVEVFMIALLFVSLLEAGPVDALDRVVHVELVEQRLVVSNRPGDVVVVVAVVVVVVVVAPTWLSV